MSARTRSSPLAWVDRYCPSLDGQYLFLDPISWQTHKLTPGAALVLREAALAIEEARLESFLDEVEEAGGWPAGLEFLARSLLTLGENEGKSHLR